MVSSALGMRLAAPAASTHARQHPPSTARRQPCALPKLQPSAAAAAAATRATRQRPRDAACSSSASGAAAEEERVGVVIVDHGSRKAESNDALFEFAALYRQITQRQLVEVAHMEIAEPTIEQAVGKCVAAGARRVIIAPYFLSRGRHVQQDIPELVQAAAAAYPGVECVVAEPIGIDVLMAQLIDNRVAAAEAKSKATATAASGEPLGLLARLGRMASRLG